MDELLLNGDSLNIYGHNLQKLLTQIFNGKMELALVVLSKIYYIAECPYPFRNKLKFKSWKICTVSYGIETATFLDLRIQNYIRIELKKFTSLNEFR